MVTHRRSDPLPVFHAANCWGLSIELCYQLPIARGPRVMPFKALMNGASQLGICPLSRSLRHLGHVRFDDSACFRRFWRFSFGARGGGGGGGLLIRFLHHAHVELAVPHLLCAGTQVLDER